MSRSIPRGRLGKEGEAFFFEKKKQKTFTTLSPPAGQSGDSETKVFCFFFSKKKAFLAFVPTPQTLTLQARRSPDWRPLAWFLGAVAFLLLAAWTVPPMLDWGRFRNAIASIAAARLGRPVVIGGEISLRLLPQAVLTATDVTLADPGDGVSVQVAALRLQVATLPLAAGRLVLRDLVLSAPVLHLPWSLPSGLGQSARPQVPHPFAARIENGSLRIGEAEVSGITASIHGGPALGGGEAADGVPASAFGAEGFALAGGRSWRFTAALGAPDADGVSAVDIAVRGQGAVADTGGSLQGTLADGVMQGRLRAGGPDLSLLLPASAASWTAEAPFVADATRIEANAIGLSLGGAPADGALVLQIDTPARLEGHLHAASLDLDGWAALLGRSLRAAPGGGLALPLRIGLSAESARLLGGRLGAVQATLVSDGHTVGFEHAAAGLPGGARLASDQVSLARAAGGPLAASGRASLSAPDLHATLAWLRALAPALGEAVPAGVLRSAELTGVLTVQAGRASVAGLAGQVDGGAVSGDAALLLEGSPSLSATLSLAELPLDAWLGEAASAGSLAGLAAHFTRADTVLHVRAARAMLRGQVLDGLDVVARTGPGGLRVERAQAGLDGAMLTLTGALGPDGTLAGVRLTAEASAMDGVLQRLPAAARVVPGLWHGGGALQVAASGHPDAVSLQVRADLADLVLEADCLRDTRAGSGATTLTLRHPGAPRLLAELGLPQALGLPAGLARTAQWLDTGALTLRAHFQDAPGRLAVQDFDLDAAALRVSGTLAADWSGPAPVLAGSLAFDQLALPGELPDLAQAAGMAGWASRFHITAGRVTAGLRPVAAHAAADLVGGGGRIRLEAVSADVAGGRLTGQAGADLAPHFSTELQLTDARITGALTGWPIDLVSGSADLRLSLDLAGSSLVKLSGTAQVQLHDAAMTGFDLAQVTAAAALRPRAGRAALHAAVRGTSPNLSGTADAVFGRGLLTLSAARFASAAGTVETTCVVDLARATVEAGVRLSPALPTHGGLSLRLSGPWDTPILVVEDAGPKPGRAKPR